MLLRLSIINSSAFLAFQRLIPFLARLPSSVILTAEYYFPNLPPRSSEVVRKARCYSKGKYCAGEKTQWPSNDVLDEGIRQICAYNIWKSGHEASNTWLIYLLNFSNCVVQSGSSSLLECYNSVRLSEVLPASFFAAIDRCYLESFSEIDPYLSENSVLSRNVPADSSQPIGVVPALFVQNELVRPQLNPQILIREICTRLGRGCSFCTSFFSTPLSFKRKIDPRVSTAMIILIIILCFLLSTVVVKLLPRWQKDKISKELAEYTTDQVNLLTCSTIPSVDFSSYNGFLSSSY